MDEKASREPIAKVELCECIHVLVYVLVHAYLVTGMSLRALEFNYNKI